MAKIQAAPANIQILSYFMFHVNIHNCYLMYIFIDNLHSLILPIYYQFTIILQFLPSDYVYIYTSSL